MKSAASSSPLVPPSQWLPIPVAGIVSSPARPCGDGRAGGRDTPARQCPLGVSAWPPKPFRIAESTFSANVCSWRERKRV